MPRFLRKLLDQDHKLPEGSSRALVISRQIQQRNGLPNKLLKIFHGIQHQNIYFEIGTRFSVSSSKTVLGPWE